MGQSWKVIGLSLCSSLVHVAWMNRCSFMGSSKSGLQQKKSNRTKLYSVYPTTKKCTSLLIDPALQWIGGHVAYLSYFPALLSFLT